MELGGTEKTPSRDTSTQNFLEERVKEAGSQELRAWLVSYQSIAFQGLLTQEANCLVQEETPAQLIDLFC